MTLVVGAPTSRIDTLAPLEVQGSPQTALMGRVIDLAGLDSLVPLTRVRYVDPNTTVPAAQRNGSIAYPFATLAAAVADLTPLGGGTVMLTPGMYTEPQVNIPANTPINLMAVGWRFASSSTVVSFANSVASQSDLGAYGCQFINALITNQRLTAVECSITNAQGGSGVHRMVSCQVANLNFGGTLEMYLCTHTGSSTLAAVNMYWSQSIAIGFACSGNLRAFFSIFSGPLTQTGGTQTVLRNCNLFQLFTPVGSLLSADLNVLAPTMGAGLNIGGTCNPVVVAPRLSVTVAVPVVAAGEVGYVDVSLVGTDLEKLVTATSMLIANPTSDVEPAGPGGGFINVRANGASTARFAFLGPLLGGNVDFLLGVI